MEKVVRTLNQYCSFPKIEAVKLFKLTIFNFLIGNEDMHLKNFSLITQEKITKLSPAYDLLNTTIALKNAKEEIALPLNGKKNNLKRKDLIDYFGLQLLALNSKVIEQVLMDINGALPAWRNLIERSFLSEQMKKQYLNVLATRLATLNLNPIR